MSTLYNVEPQPTGKAIIRTTSGDLELELFAQQTPLACRNFIQHCLDGYYDNTIFHRLVPGFIIQGGDPTGTGHGGQSSFDGGAPFEDEVHSRLRFNRRGLLGMANTGTRDDNGSQFFLTLGKADELTGKNTMFGRIEGNTIFNLVKMGEAELTEEQDSDRPMFPTTITGTEVLLNPFEGMVKRTRIAERTVEQRPAMKKKAKKKAGKQMLSFGDEEVADDGPVALQERPKFNPKLVNTIQDDSIPKRAAPKTVEQARPAKRQKTQSPSPQLAEPVKPFQSQQIDLDSGSESDSESEPIKAPSKPDALALANAQIASLKQSLRRNVPKTENTTLHKKSALESMMPATATRGRKRRADGSGGPGQTPSKDEQRALADFNAFARRLEQAQAEHKASAPKEIETIKNKLAEDVQPSAVATSAEDDGDEAFLCDLHFIANCQSCQEWDADGAAADDDDDVQALMTHKLTFEKDRLGKDLEWKRQNEQNLVVIDPRERAKEFKAEKKRKKDGQ